MQFTHLEQSTTRARPVRSRLNDKATRDRATRFTAVATAATPAIFAHDMRGPLANLTILLEAIAAAAGSGHADSIGRHVDRALQTVERLGGMLTAMLGRFRELGDPLAPAAGDIDLSEVTEKVAALNRPLAESRQVRLHCSLADPLPVRGDAHLLMQAIDNLLSNALTHTAAGGRVVCETSSAEDGGVVVRVTDEGPGLSAVELTRLFQPFGTATAQKGSGRSSHGLGLWIVALIAERHGGRVEASSAGPGMGAAFSLHLPARRGDDQ